MRLNRRVPVGTHGGVRGRLSYLFRGDSYSIFWDSPKPFVVTFEYWMSSSQTELNRYKPVPKKQSQLRRYFGA